LDLLISRLLRRSYLVAALVGCLIHARAEAKTPAGQIQATVNDSGIISGFLTLDDPSLTLVNPLLSLPEPETDRTFRRTYPHAADAGEMRFGRTGDGRWWFATRLPDRFGDLGHTRHGSFANGSWYPQPLKDGLPHPIQWEVALETPSNMPAAVGNTVGKGALRWAGTTTAVSLAILPRGEIFTLEGTETRPQLNVLHRGHSKPLLDFLEAHWGAITEPLPLEDAVVVIAPLRRRLVRSGSRMTYVSDRAFRLTPGFRTVHRQAVVRGTTESQIPAPPLLASTAAALLAHDYEAAQRQSVAEGVLRYGGWNPVVFSLLHSGTMAFYSDTLGLIHPSDPLQDGLLERLSPATPGTVIAAQLRQRWGEEEPLLLARTIAQGEPVADGSAALLGAIEDWRTPYPEQDYAVSVNQRLQEVLIQRIAPENAPPEALTIRQGKSSQEWLTGTGSDTLTLPLDQRPIRVDALGVTRQRSRANDSWPTRYSLTSAAAIYTLNLRRAYMEAFAAAWLRPASNSRHIGSLSLSTNRENRVSVSLGYTHQFGQSITGTARSQRVGISVRSALLNPNYATIAEQRATTESYLSWRWSTRDDDIFPRRGHALGLNGGGGISPGTSLSWWSVGAAGSKLLSPHPHHVLALRGAGALAQSDLDHRLLDLGGPAALRSLPTGQWLAQRRLVGIIEYRHAIARDLSVPMFLAWGSQLQVTAGLECGAAYLQEEAIEACGVTAGLAGSGDGLGGIEQLVGLTAGWPLWASHSGLKRSPVPEIYLRMWQEF
jgi:hypothetical protein